MAEADTAPRIAPPHHRTDDTALRGTREYALLVACLKTSITGQNEGAVRDLLHCPIDWTSFARKVSGHDLSAPVAQILLRIAPDLLPEEIHYAFKMISNEARGTSAAVPEPFGPEQSDVTDHVDGLLALVTGAGSPYSLSLPYAAAAFLKSCPSLSWDRTLTRARDRNCLRILLLTTLLANECFGSPLPQAVASYRRDVANLQPVIRRLVAHWQTNDTSELGCRLTLKEQMCLHDRFSQRWRHAFCALAENHHSLLLFRRMPQSMAALGGAWRTSAIGLAILPRTLEEKSQIKRYRVARQAARESLARNADDGAAWRNLGHALFGLGRHRNALNAYDKALIFEPEHPTVWQNRSAAIEALGGDEETYPGMPRPNTMESWLIRAGRFYRSQQFAKASDACDRVLALDPENVAAKRLGIHCRLHSCDWARREVDKRTVTAGLNAGDFVIRTLDHRALSDSEQENRLAARLVAEAFRKAGEPVWQGVPYRHDKIRVAYLSTDFHTHAVATLLIGCIEHHDRSRFEIIAVSLQPGDGSDLRRRLEKAFDRFVHAHKMSDAAVAQLLRSLEIDIAVDLNGYTGRIRTGILARRPAPVQVSYLGFAGTMDAPFIDYVLADAIVLPKENKVHYRERVVYLPYTFMPSDDARGIAQNTPERVDVGLPQTGFVFACLSYAHKISPELFDTWMRLLLAVDCSVLWLRSANAEAVANLRREAAVRDVSPDRLIFAPPVASEADYLARLRLADLFLDTLPYNAHATACDALWAGLPLVTCAGASFHSRVAASLLCAAGVPELVTTSLVQYEAVARSLATDAVRLAALRLRLASNRETCPLFNTARMTRDLEAAYTAMRERSRRGEPPESFAVPPEHSVATTVIT